MGRRIDRNLGMNPVNFHVHSTVRSFSPSGRFYKFVNNMEFTEFSVQYRYSTVNLIYLMSHVFDTSRPINSKTKPHKLKNLKDAHKYKLVRFIGNS